MKPDFPSPDSLPPSGGLRADPQAELLERLRRATVGEYDILAQLGFGGMASVYLAHDLALDRRVAIKVMSPAMVYGPGMVERFRLEARTAAALSHPNIIPIYAVREVDDLLFFVMKLVEGTSLDAVIAEVGPLPIAMVEAILAQAGGALGYAHRRNVVHRDVKPANILLDEEGWVVVTDFGIAKVTDASALTMTGMAVGTPTYMSPEQCAGGVITGASDQYSLGVVAYEMLTGRPPFVEQSIPALMLGHTTKAPPSIADVRPDCPPALRTAVARMLVKDPDQRYGSLEDAIAAADARPLSPDDSTRGTLVALAKHSSTRNLIAQVRTPRSPVPLIRRSGGQPSVPAPRRGRSALLIGFGLAMGVAATAMVAVALRQAQSPTVVAATDPVPPPVAASPDTLVPGPSEREARPAAVPAPSRPIRSAAAPVTPPPAITVAPPEPPPGGGVDSLITRVTPQVVERPGPKAESPSQPRVVEPPPPLTPAPDPGGEIQAAVQAYARALEAGRIDQAVGLFPGMPTEQRQGLEAFYRDGGSMRTNWRVEGLTVSGATATLRIVGENQVRTSRSGPSQQPVALRARMERRPNGWRFVALAN